MFYEMVTPGVRGHSDKGRMIGEVSRIGSDIQGSRKGPMHPLRFSSHESQSFVPGNPIQTPALPYQALWPLR